LRQIAGYATENIAVIIVVEKTGGMQVPQRVRADPITVLAQGRQLQSASASVPGRVLPVPSFLPDVHAPRMIRLHVYTALVNKSRGRVRNCPVCFTFLYHKQPIP